MPMLIERKKWSNNENEEYENQSSKMSSQHYYEIQSPGTNSNL